MLLRVNTYRNFDVAGWTGSTEVRSKVNVFLNWPPLIVHKNLSVV
jgi:hypothetical protein